MVMCGKNSQKISAVIWSVSAYVAIRREDSIRRNGSNTACFELTKNCCITKQKEEKMFDEYVCGVTGLPCCGCSLFCQNRKEKDNNNPAKPEKSNPRTELLYEGTDGKWHKKDW